MLGIHRWELQNQPCPQYLYWKMESLLENNPLPKFYEKYIQFKTSFFKTICSMEPRYRFQLSQNLEGNLSLKDLSEKLVILLCFLSGQREQTIKALNIKHIILGKR